MGVSVLLIFVSLLEFIAVLAAPEDYSKIGNSVSSSSLFQLALNLTTKSSLSVPPAPFTCHYGGLLINFFDYTPVFTWKAPMKAFADAGERAIRREARRQRLAMTALIPGLSFEYVYRNFEYNAVADHLWDGRLTFDDVFATFACIPRFVDQWQHRGGVGGARFEISVGVSGHFGLVT
ncbi:hypothetical protein ACLMJK_007458 [Lecanora helva]